MRRFGNQPASFPDATRRRCQPVGIGRFESGRPWQCCRHSAACRDETAWRSAAQATQSLEETGWLYRIFAAVAAYLGQF